MSKRERHRIALIYVAALICHDDSQLVGDGDLFNDLEAIANGLLRRARWPHPNRWPAADDVAELIRAAAPPHTVVPC